MQELLSRAPIISCRKGTNLFLAGDPCTCFYRILSGRCESYRNMPGGTARSIEVFGPGDYLGEADLTGHRNYHTSSRVITDSVLQKIRNEDLRGILKENGNPTATSEEVCLDPIFPTEEEICSGRIIAAVCLSPKLPRNLIVENLARSIYAETTDSVLLVQFTGIPGHLSLIECTNSEPLINGDLHWREWLPKGNGSVSRITVSITGNSREAACIAPFLSRLSRHFDYIVVQGTLDEIALEPLVELVIQADASYLFVHPKPEDLRGFDSFIGNLRSQARGDCSELNPVICLGSNERVTDGVKLYNGEAHAFVHDCPAVDPEFPGASGLPYTFERDIRRLAREIGHCRVGLALSAGGAKGLTHIGVIQVLEENGIEVDFIVGCSMGAYVAACWALGCDGQIMETLAREVEGRWGFWRLIDPVIPPRQGFMHGEAVKNRLKKTIGEARFSDLVRPLRVVATNLDSLERVVFSSGNVAQAVHASCAIPGIVVPVTINGETYIDGGVADPLPVDVLAEAGIDRIIAVNTLPPSSFLRCCREIERERASLSKKRFKPLRALAQRLNYFASGNILDTMMRAVHGSQIGSAELACRQANVVLRPLSIDARWHDFNHPGKYIALGRQVALQHLDELKALVRKKGPRHEPRIAHHQLATVA